MVKGRIWRLLLLFFLAYAIFIFSFFRSFNSDETTTVSSVAGGRVIVDVEEKPNNPVHPIEVRDSGKSEDKPPIVPPNVNEKDRSSLEPVMNKDRLGNYEPTNVVKASGPGEDGEGVQLNGDEEKKRGEESVAEYGFNQVASEKISLDRRARDTR